MTKEELIKLSRENLKKSKQGSLCECYDEAFVKGYQLSEKHISELELKIKYLTEHLGLQAMSALFEQVEEEVRQEQRLNELEKENAELKTKKIPQLERKIASIRGAHSVDCRKLNARIEQCKRQKKQIFGLEKENAELKVENAFCEKACEGADQMRKDLKTAKEIILKLVDTQYRLDPYRDIFKDRIAEAEQFLKEVSE